VAKFLSLQENNGALGTANRTKKDVRDNIVHYCTEKPGYQTGGVQNTRNCTEENFWQSAKTHTKTKSDRQLNHRHTGFMNFSSHVTRNVYNE
jgi:hypothetical protein